MKKFSQIHEAKKPKRVGIQHLSQIKPVDFIKLVNLFQEMGGKISQKNANVSLKVDGFALFFGLTEDGTFWLSSANSGPQTTGNAFTQYTIKRKGKADKISIAYDELFNSLKNNKALQGILKKNNKNGIKVQAECLYNPIGQKDKGKIKFVAISYDLKSLGEIATIVLINIQDGKLNSLIPEIKKLSTNEFKFTDPNTTIEQVDLNIEIQDTLKFIKKYPDFEKQVISRKHADREVKKLIKDGLQYYQDQMQDKFLKAVKSAKFSDEFEGIVIKLSNGVSFKAITKDFKNTKKFRPKG